MIASLRRVLPMTRGSTALVDRREKQGTQEGATDIGDDCGVGVAGLGAQLLPFGIIAEGAPKLVARRHALERKHVSQTRQVAPHDGFAEEDGCHAEPLENSSLALVEHLDLAPGG